MSKLKRAQQWLCGLVYGHSYGPETATNIAYLAFDVVKTCALCDHEVMVHEDVPAAHHPSREKSHLESPYETSGDKAA